MRTRLSFCLLLPALLSACSSQQVFYGLRERERNLCAEGPEVQYEECLRRIEMDYEEYRKQSGG